MTDNTPKCLLKVGDKTILQMTIDNILKNGISEFVMVTGFRENMIKEFIANNYPGLNIKYLTNPGYENNNNSYSLWMTKDLINKECILLDSDILFDYRIVSKLQGSKHQNCLAVNCNHKLGDEEIKVIVDSTNKILHIGKEVETAKSLGESIGIEKFNYSFFNALGEVLERKIVKESNVSEFYEVSFQELIDRGNSLYAVDVSEYRSMEIDTPDDLHRANLEFNKLGRPSG